MVKRSMERTISIQIPSSKQLTLTHSSTSLIVESSGSSKQPLDIPLRYLINATYYDETHSLHIAYLTKRKKYTLVNLDGTVEKDLRSNAAQWAQALQTAAYSDHGIQRCRRLKVLVNPHSGQGKGKSIYISKVTPIFEAAGCTLDVTYTTHRYHAYDITKSLSLDYDALVVVSGDGLIHEVFNGFAEHDTPAKAFQIPVAPIPTGSGNGLSLNLLGLEDGFDASLAALNVVKGSPMKIDLFSVIQGDNRMVSFMSQCVGLMADLDIGTEHMRWMGDTRFTVGFFLGFLMRKSYPVELSFKLVEHDKTRIVERMKTSPSTDVEALPHGDSGSMISDTSSSSRPGPTADDEGWTVFDKPVLYVYAGQGPYVGRDYMAFPASLPDDGCIDLVACEMTRLQMIKATESMINGQIFWHPKVHYFKVEAFRIKPLADKGFVSVDGEAFPFNEFRVEMHPNKATLLSMYGRYMSNFSVTHKR